MVAAVGNGDEAPTEPWPFASYPAALPHVIGVGALTRHGQRARTSRTATRVYNDIVRARAPGSSRRSRATLDRAAPGLRRPGLLRLRPARLPRPARARRSPRRRSRRPPRCCSRADPALTPDQVAYARSSARADDVNAASGCTHVPAAAATRSPAGDASTSRRRSAALAGPAARRPTRYETNDDAGTQAHTLCGAHAHDRRRRSTTGTTDVDVYRVYARASASACRERLRRRGRRARQPAALEARDAARRRARTRRACTPRRPLAAARLGAAASRYTRAGARLVLPRGRRSRTPGSGAVHAARVAQERRELGRYWFSSSSSSGTSRSTRAGLPTTTLRGGTSFVTTAPAPTNASSPISTPGQRIAPPPTRAPRRIVGPFDQLVALLGAAHEVVVRRDDAGRDEDVLLERRVGGDVGARPGSSSRAPIVVSFSTSEPRPITTSSPIVDALAHARLVADDHARADRRARRRRSRRSRRSSRRRSPPAAAARASRSSAARASAACRRPRPRAPSRPRRAPCPGRRSRSGGPQRTRASP